MGDPGGDDDLVNEPPEPAAAAYSGGCRRFPAPGAFCSSLFGVHADIRSREPGAGQSMTAIQSTILAPVPAFAPAPPRIRAIVGRVAMSLATAVVAPAAVFAATMAVLNLVAAVVAGGLWMIGAMCWRWATRRPVSSLLLLALALMLVRTAVMLATANRFVYFVQPVVVDAVIAAIFLGSLWSARPAAARLAPDFYPLDAAMADQPGIRGLFRRLTMLWGLVMLAKGIVTLWLLQSLSTMNFVLIKSGTIFALTLLATTATVAWSVVVARQEGLLPSAPRAG